METEQHKPWHSLSVQETEQILRTTDDGLSDAEAAKRLAEYGRNNLREKKPKSIWKMIWEQLTDVMVIILLIAAAFSLVMYFIEDEGLAECIVILVVIALNATIGVIQEKKAVKRARGSQKYDGAHRARHARRGRERRPRRENWSPGDVVYLGRRLPSCPRISASYEDSNHEGAGSGPHRRKRALPKKTVPTVLPEDAPLGDRVNMAYSSSISHVRQRDGHRGRHGHGHGSGQDRGACWTNRTSLDTPMKRKLNSVGKTPQRRRAHRLRSHLCHRHHPRRLGILGQLHFYRHFAGDLHHPGRPARHVHDHHGAGRAAHGAKRTRSSKACPRSKRSAARPSSAATKRARSRLNKMTVTHVAVGGRFSRGGDRDSRWTCSHRKYGRASRTATSSQRLGAVRQRKKRSR